MFNEDLFKHLFCKFVRSIMIQGNYIAKDVFQTNCQYIQEVLADSLQKYNKDVVCIFDKDRPPVCKIISMAGRRSRPKDLPSHDPYIPRKFSVFYSCGNLKCEQLFLGSLTQITDPELVLKGCFKTADKYECESLRYHHMKNIDKLLFLNSHVKDKEFYTVDCLVYEDGGRVCHKKEPSNSHIKLVDTGTIIRPNETNVLSQDEFVCEESVEGYVNCDIIPFVSIDEKLVLRESLITSEKVMLKTGNYVVALQKNCIGTWCGYSGVIVKSARRARYEPPGGKIFRCFYAKKQQVCKQLPPEEIRLHDIYGGGGYPPYGDKFDFGTGIPDPLEFKAG